MSYVELNPKIFNMKIEKKKSMFCKAGQGEVKHYSDCMASPLTSLASAQLYENRTTYHCIYNICLESKMSYNQYLNYFCNTKNMNKTMTAL